MVCIDTSDKKIVGEARVGDPHQVAPGPDGETIAVETADHQGVRFHHLPTKADRCVLRVAASEFAFAPDGKMLVTIDSDGRAALWDATSGKRVRDLDGHLANKDFRILGVSKDGRARSNASYSARRATRNASYAAEDFHRSTVRSWPDPSAARSRSVPK